MPDIEEVFDRRDCRDYGKELVMGRARIEIKKGPILDVWIPNKGGGFEYFNLS